MVKARSATDVLILLIFFSSQNGISDEQRLFHLYFCFLGTPSFDLPRIFISDKGSRSSGWRTRVGSMFLAVSALEVLVATAGPCNCPTGHCICGPLVAQHKRPVYPVPQHFAALADNLGRCMLRPRVLRGTCSARLLLPSVNEQPSFFSTCVLINGPWVEQSISCLVAKTGTVLTHLLAHHHRRRRRRRRRRRATSCADDASAQGPTSRPASVRRRLHLM